MIGIFGEIAVLGNYVTVYSADEGFRNYYPCFTYVTID